MLWSVGAAGINDMIETDTYGPIFRNWLGRSILAGSLLFWTDRKEKAAACYWFKKERERRKKRRTRGLVCASYQ